MFHLIHSYRFRRDVLSTVWRLPTTFYGFHIHPSSPIPWCWRHLSDLNQRHPSFTSSSMTWGMYAFLWMSSLKHLRLFERIFWKKFLNLKNLFCLGPTQKTGGDNVITYVSYLVYSHTVKMRADPNYSGTPSDGVFSVEVTEKPSPLTLASVGLVCNP